MTFDPNQPRDPKGSPTGGQWTSSHAKLTFDVKRGVTDATRQAIENELKHYPPHIRQILEDSNIDLYIVDQLGPSTEGGWVTLKHAVGVYHGGSPATTNMHGAKIPAIQSRLVVGQRSAAGDRSRDVGKTFTHEVGHHLDRVLKDINDGAKPSNDKTFQDRWDRSFKRLPTFQKQAMKHYDTNYKEAWAETFAHIHGQSANSGWIGRNAFSANFREAIDIVKGQLETLQMFHEDFQR